ncbi:TPA: hypothetical protein DCE37_23140 [Candidatus Latescibacteria bacterium]|nr:hypothetical protein [Candidatus Latescibacterota bacterium]
MRPAAKRGQAYRSWGIITLKATLEGEEARIDVQDTGHGIPADYLETISEQFGKIEIRQRTGTGLRLTFCKMAVEAHGGRIWVKSVGEREARSPPPFPWLPRKSRPDASRPDR